MTNANPSVNPADTGTEKGMLRHVIKKMLQGVNNMLPCQVLAFERSDPPRVQVQHLVFQVTTSGQQISRGQIASLPVLQLGGGGFVLSFNLKKGDLGWIKACDRDISNFLKSYSNAAPQTYRMFDFADALFIPDAMHDYTVDSEDAENVVLQSLDGSVKISMGLDKITYKAPLHVFQGPIECDDMATFKAPVDIQAGLTATGGGANSIVINGNQIISGNQRVDGDITAGGDITPHVP